MQQTMPPEFVIIYNPYFLFLWGAAFGSFANVLFYRVPLRRSIVSPGSACPHCRKPIRFFDNVPVLAWLWLRGKCRQCKAPISPIYPCIEAAFGLMFLIPYYWLPLQPVKGLALGFLLISAASGAFLFYKCRRIPWYVLAVFILTWIPLFI